ncbi:MAG: T9SS type A sorting domain-containing protein, partial [Bacteroidota bacterium]
PSNPVSSSGTTAVTTGGDVPSVFALEQNYPNPFNPTTNIVFDVPNESYVRLEVYNALGQRVAELVAAQVMAGRHTARFDASGLPSGLYVARMTSGEFAATRKVNLIK